MKCSSSFSFVILMLFLIPNLISQDIDQIIASLEIDTFLYSGPKDNRINFAIQNRGVSNPNGDFEGKEEFFQLYQDDLFQAFTLGGNNEQAPYAQYRNFFNLYAMWWPEALNDDNGWNFGIIKDIRDSLFLPWGNDETGWATLFSTTRHGGGGGAGLDREKRVGDGKMYGMGWETFLHEFGHTMPGLLDEYSASGEWSGGNCWETGNSTSFLNKDDIPWRKWIEDDIPLPTPYTAAYLDKIGAFEGAMTNYFGCHRPTARGCFMGAGGFGEDYGLELCPVCTQRVICYLYKYVNPIENYTPAENSIDITGIQTLNFSVEALSPIPNTQKYAWYVNGKLVKNDALSLEYEFGHCLSYEVKFTLHDTNTLVRYDEKFEDTYPKPYREMIWMVDVNDVNDYPFNANVETQNADCSGINNGSVSFDISEGIAPYSLSLIDHPDLELAQMPAGTYVANITDGNACRLIVPFEIGQDVLLEYDICTAFSDEKWIAEVFPNNYAINDLAVLWSNGDNGPQTTSLENGTYSVTVSTVDGCDVSSDFGLMDFNIPLEVTEKFISASPGASNGSIYLDIQGGIPEYGIHWFDLKNEDITSTTLSSIDASGTTWDHLPEYAFDNNLNTKWLHFVSENAWISYYEPNGAILNAYSITSGDDVPGRDPKNWSFEGSNDGMEWFELDAQSDQDFEKRKLKKTYSFNNDKSFQYFRFYVHENHGDGSIQLQQLEFIGIKTNAALVENHLVKDQHNRTDLAAGLYVYHLNDENLDCLKDTIKISSFEDFGAASLTPIQFDDCSVTLMNLNSDYEYYWFADVNRKELLHVGDFFSPAQEGNFFVSAVDPLDQSISTNIKGFAVQMPEVPSITLQSDSSLVITDPINGLKYKWYNENDCSSIIHTGISFTPTISGTYYASAFYDITFPDPIDPASIEGMIIRIDASDLNGDAIIDDPQQVTGSTYDWFYSNGNNWGLNDWFAYRSNYQNGLGVADFATIWLQKIEKAESGYQTILLAYEENPISFPKKAAFEGLSYHLPKHIDGSQLLHDDAPESTLNGTTYLNGNIVDPLQTEQDFRFNILGTVLTETSNKEIFYTDTHWEGKIGEIILWDHVLTEQEMIGASEFLRKKWISTATLGSPRVGIYWPYGPSAVHEIYENLVDVYPNPTADILTVRSNGSNWSYTLFDMQGRILLEEHFTPEFHFINLKAFSSGTYIMRFMQPDGSYIFKKIQKI